MKKLFFFLLVTLFAAGCGLRSRELELEKKLAEVNQKEQELVLKEKSLQMREDELAQKEKLLDISAADSVDGFIAEHPNLPGKWTATMRCTETNCSGWAIGDTKIEQWEISYQKGGIVAQAFSNNILVRVYTGSHTGNAIELSTGSDTQDPNTATRMTVRIQDIKDNEMVGQRDIIRPDNCHIIYSLELKRQ